jgi:hypothetical protein
MDLHLLAPVVLLWAACAPAPTTGGADSRPHPGDTDTDADTDESPAPDGPALYSATQVHSPLTPWVVDLLTHVVAQDTGLYDDIFMKVGASGTVSSNFLHCFADDPDLGDHDHLQSALDLFLDADADGTTPFDRDTLAAKVGASTGWALSGSPSPIDQEMAAISPRFALVAYGTNDMHLGTTYHSASHGYAANLLELTDLLLAAGVVPVVAGVPQRGDSAGAAEWAPVYNTIARGVAQSRQVPFLDLHAAYADLDGFGLASDGVHGTKSPNGACAFDESDLGYSANVRNLITLEALDRLQTQLYGTSPVAETAPILAGDGSIADPYSVKELPFTHFADTSVGALSETDSYPDCSDANEAGPERRYQFTLDHDASLRAIVFDPGDTDIDLHLLDDSGVCLGRAHQLLEADVGAGSYTIVADSWTDDGGVSYSGEYLLVVTEQQAPHPD